MNNERNDQMNHGHAFAHAIETLEFGGVLEHIASGCVNEPAKAAILALRPTTNRESIERSLAAIEETIEYQSINGKLPIAETHARRWIESAVDRNEVILPEGFLDIAAVERAAIELRRRIKKEELYPALRRMVLSMTPQEEFVASIDRAIDRDAGIKDKASPALKSLRNGVRHARNDLRRYVDGVAKSLGAEEYATFTGTRYMLLLPRDKCQRREGIVHSTSQSGGSLYFEPLPLVEKNNTLETLLADVKAEEARILAELTRLVVGLAGELEQNLLLWEALDALSAKARFAEVFECIRPAYSANGTLELVDARHPLLQLSLAGEEGTAVVPLNLSLTVQERVLVITGPNAGGKTVALKTTGLVVLMYQSGLPVPCAEGTELTIFNSVHADIGDEQSIATSLSTFTSHLKHLDTMCRRANDGVLCLIDEIGDGTDPDEGAALAIAALERLIERRATVIATTHFGKVKTFALRTDGVSNASVAFDEENDRPLYRLLQGTAGRSRGIETARRLGFLPPVVDAAESMVGEESFRLEKLLSELESHKLAIERERSALEEQSEALGRLIQSCGAKERDIIDHRKDHEARARREAEDILVRARREVEDIVKDIRESAARRDVVRGSHERIRKQLDEVRARPKEPKRAVSVTPGEHVALSPTGAPGGVVMDVRNDSATVDINGKKIRVKVANLYKIKKDDETESAAPRRQQSDIQVDVEPLQSTTVDVRGQTREEALETVDVFLDRAMLNGVREVKIIHGIGEGVLVRAIDEYLADDPRVTSKRRGGLGEGGAGVSFIHLK
jgi:DNA mismatch repair protein MutS2